jgi:hypothetical protein
LSGFVLDLARGRGAATSDFSPTASLIAVHGVPFLKFKLALQISSPFS